MTLQLLNASSSFTAGIFTINSHISASGFTGSLNRTNSAKSLFVSSTLNSTVTLSSASSTQIIFGNIPSFNLVYFTANNPSYTIPSPYTVVQIWARGGAPGGMGGGGGGSGGSGSTGGGGGGACGGVGNFSANWAKFPTYIPAGRTVNVLVGIGGAGGTSGSGGTNGQNGLSAGIGNSGQSTFVSDNANSKLYAFVRAPARSSNTIPTVAIGFSGSTVAPGAGGAQPAGTVTVAIPTLGPDGASHWNSIQGSYNAPVASTGGLGGSTAGGNGVNTVGRSVSAGQWYGSRTYILPGSGALGGAGSGGTHGGGGAGSSGGAAAPGCEIETSQEVIPLQLIGIGGVGGEGGAANSSGAGAAGATGSAGISGSNGRSGGGGGGGGGGGAGLTAGGNGGNGGVGGAGSPGAVIFFMQAQ